jgi:hypothetical protein
VGYPRGSPFKQLAELSWSSLTIGATARRGAGFKLGWGVIEHARRPVEPSILTAVQAWLSSRREGPFIAAYG